MTPLQKTALTSSQNFKDLALNAGSLTPNILQEWYPTQDALKYLNLPAEPHGGTTTSVFHQPLHTASPGHSVTVTRTMSARVEEHVSSGWRKLILIRGMITTSAVILLTVCHDNNFSTSLQFLNFS